jgi:hypothetical protein
MELILSKIKPSIALSIVCGISPLFVSAVFIFIRNKSLFLQLDIWHLLILLIGINIIHVLAVALILTALFNYDTSKNILTEEFWEKSNRQNVAIAGMYTSMIYFFLIMYPFSENQRLKDLMFFVIMLDGLAYIMLSVQLKWDHRKKRKAAKIAAAQVSDTTKPL